MKQFRDAHITILETVPAAEPAPDEQLMRKEDEAQMEQLKAEFNAFLGQEQALKDLFSCLCAGITKRAAIASKLGLTPKLVTFARKRLDRRVVEFRSKERGSIPTFATDTVVKA